MTKSHNPSDFDELILKKLDGTITPADYQRLVSLIENNPEFASYYIDFTMLYVGLSEPGKIAFSAENEKISQNYYNSLLAQLAENEKIASAVDIPHSRPVAEEIQKNTEVVRPARHISPFNVWMAIGTIAALLFIVAYPRMLPEKVAVVTDAIDVHWSGNRSLIKGDRLYDDKKLLDLQSGLVKISFDFGAELILEGPAQFSLVSEEKMYLHSGRVFARVPTRAVGFVVDTPSAGIIDLGTEFGVQVEKDGSSQVHLFKGKASLMAGIQGARRDSQILEKGSSRRVDPLTHHIEVISPDNHYAQQIDSAHSFIWRGESINLADFIGHGNGFGTGIIGGAINPVSGLEEMLTVPMPGENEGPKGEYVKTAWNPFVDGIFVPDGSIGPTVVSSAGHVFASCPDTSGTYWTPVSNGGLIAPNQELEKVELMLNGLSCGNKTNPAIFIHSNLGITFNLEAIRACIPNITVTEFSAVCGISENTPKRFARAEFWVLIDGKVRFHKTADGALTSYPISLAIAEQDCFLTLIVTDGGTQTIRKAKKKFALWIAIGEFSWNPV